MCRHISHDWGEPLDRVSFKAEGTFEYQTLLFIPENPPMDMYWRDAKYGLQLYVNRVLIQDRCEELVPSYLRFLKGVVDSPASRPHLLGIANSSVQVLRSGLESGLD